MMETKKQYRARMRKLHGAEWYKKVGRTPAKSRRTGKYSGMTSQQIKAHERERERKKKGRLAEKRDAARVRRAWPGWPAKIGTQWPLLRDDFGSESGVLVYESEGSMGDDYSGGVLVERQGDKYSLTEWGGVPDDQDDQDEPPFLTGATLERALDAMGD